MHSKVQVRSPSLKEEKHSFGEGEKVHQGLMFQYWMCLQLNCKKAVHDRGTTCSCIKNQLQVRVVIVALHMCNADVTKM